MKNHLRIVLLFISAFACKVGLGQTSWIGATSTDWATTANWTAGVPNSSTDAIVGDANFTGAYQPVINSGSACKSITIGGMVAGTLTVNKTFVITGNLTINANGALVQNKTTISLAGDWSNSGVYNANNNNTSLIFNGTNQTLGGSAITTFRKLSINASSKLTLAANCVLSGQGSSLVINGTLNPGESPTYQITSPNLTLTANAVLKVNASTFAGNYAVSGVVTLNAGSVVEYSATTISQTIGNAYTYSTLRISGSGVKTLGGNLPPLNSSAAAYGNIYVTSGTLDLSTYTANRGSSVAGGSFSVSNGATLKIGGSNSFPLNYATKALSLTSTVEYNGGAQTVAAETYGNLVLSGNSGAVTKTMPGSEFTVSGDFTTTTGAAGSVSATAASNVTITGNVNIGSNTVFNAGAWSHRITGNWLNNGTVNGNTGTMTLNGSGATVAGSGAYNFNNLTVTASNNTFNSNLTVSGDLATTGSGAIIVSPDKTVTLNGSNKTISGTAITLDNLSITGSVTTNASLTVTGNIQVSGSFTASGGTITMSGASKTILNSGTLTFHSLTSSGVVTTTSGFSIAGSLNVSGSFTAASPGTINFVGASSLNGTASLHNVTINGASFQLSSNAVLGIAGNFSIAGGTFDVTSTVPNTVNFNGTSAQTVPSATYHHLVFSNSGNKTASGNISVNGDLIINSASNFTSGNYSHVIKGNWANNGTFSAGSGTIAMEGPSDVSVTGTTTFNTLSINKMSAKNQVSLFSDLTAAVVNVNNGVLQTGSNTLTITGNRTGPGIILGTIKRQHAFTTGVNYAFESPDNFINFSSIAAVTSVTVKITKGAVTDFPYGGSVNRTYDITIPSGTYAATLRLHYEDGELNGNVEPDLQMWQFNGSAWINKGASVNNTASNYVELTGVANITGRLTLTDEANVVTWTGAVSNAWENAANWIAVQGNPSLPPSPSDIVQIGYTSFTNQPEITGAANAKSVKFGSNMAATVTIQNGASLTVAGNVGGDWAVAASHSLNNNGTLSVNGDLSLGDGTPGHKINFTNTGTTQITGSVYQSGSAAVTLTGSSLLNIGDDYNYTDGSFSPGNSTVTYNGVRIQAVAPVTYYNLVIAKSSGIASITGASTINNSLSVTGGQLDIAAAITVTGNLSIGAGGLVSSGNNTISVGGNWNNSGTFMPGTGTVQFNGTGLQTIAASTFNQLLIDKLSGTALLSGNLTINGNLSIPSGTLDLSTYSANRALNGGSLSIGNGASLMLGGNSNFPANFSQYALQNTSTVQYYGTVAQMVSGVNYGHLVLSNGDNSNVKSLAASTIINGNLTINSGAYFAAGSNTITIYGNWVNNGSFDPGSGAVLFSGSSKTISGITSFYNAAIYGSYSVSGSDITFINNLHILSGASYNAGSGLSTVQGDLTNSGTLTSNGTTTFTGTKLQTIRLLNAISSNSTGVINFNGNVSPVLNSTSTPMYATLNINNTAGINPSVNWSVFVAFNVNSGGVFNGGSSTHNFYGSFTNNGTITSSGTLNIAPATAQTVKLSGTGFSSTGLVLFAGAAAIGVTGTPAALTDVTIDNTAGVSPAGGWTIGRNFTIGSRGIFNAGAHTYTVGGDVQSDGVLNSGTSTFTLTSPNGQVAGSAYTTFYHLNINGAAITVNADINVAGNLTTTGTLDASLAEVHFTGAANASISGATTALAQFSVEKNSGATLTLARNLTAVTYLNIASGIFDEGAFTITQDVSGGNLYIKNNAVLKLGGTNTLPVFSAYALDSLSTVEYNGGTQGIAAGTVYGNLTLSTSGTKTATGALSILNNFSLTNATFAAGNYTHSVGGNWNMGSGTFTGTGSTVLFNGKGTQTISSSAAFNNLTINKTAGLASLTGSIIINGILSLTSGKLALGNHSLTMGPSASITNASALNYIIAEGSGALIQPVSTGSGKVFPVGKTEAYAPATITLTPGSTPDNFSVRLLNAPYISGLTGNPVMSNAVNTSWVINEAVAGGSDATIQLQWPQSLELSGFSRSASRLARYAGTSWEYGMADIIASGSNPYFVSRANVTSFTVFAVSSLSALPVEWLDVYGKSKGENNHIYWSTVSEKNNSHYIVEASATGIGFTAIGRVTAANTGSITNNYEFIHQNVTAEKNYYRIKQVDLDGHYSYSKVVVVENNTKELAVSANFGQNDLKLSIASSKNITVEVVLFDAGGKAIAKKSYALNQGSNSMTIDGCHVSQGIYFMQVQSAGKLLKTVKIRK